MRHNGSTRTEIRSASNLTPAFTAGNRLFNLFTARWSLRRPTIEDAHHSRWAFTALITLFSALFLWPYANLVTFEHHSLHHGSD